MTINTLVNEIVQSRSITSPLAKRNLAINSSDNNTLELMLESLPVAVIAFKNDILLYANQNYRQYLGANVSALLEPGLHLQDFVKNLYNVLDGITTADPEMDALHKTNKIKWMQKWMRIYHSDVKFEQYDSGNGWWQSINRYYPDDKLYIGIRIDISALKAAQEKAIIASKSKSEFLANMSHEIRTPMNGIMGMAELLINSDISGKEREFIEIIQRSGQSLLTIINDILDFSKIESGQIEIDMAPFVLREAIEDIMSLLSTATRETGLDLIVKIDPDLPTTFLGDVGRIRQVLMNVIGNAIKFTHEGHVLIDVSAAQTANKAEILADEIDLKIDIIDTGIGIAPEKTKYVFEQFSQADSSTTRQYGGTGLGLSIAKNLAELMGGSLSLKSEAGVGSVFTLGLSLTPSESIHRASPQPSLPITGNILIIDDTRVNHEVLKGQLENETCRTIGVESAAKGLAVLKKAQENNVSIDLILLDYHMPQHTGEDFILAMRKHSAFDHIPVIMLSSVDTDALKKRVLSSGLQGYLTKPARLAELKHVISHTLNASSRPISLPAEKQQTLAKNVEIMSHIAAQPVRTTRDSSHIDILIAEDNEVNQMYIRYIMEDLGVSFKIVENGSLAVDKWQLLKPKLIFMDVSMPLLNGYEATQKIREIEAARGYASTPIIAVTAHAMKHDRDKSIAMGMDDHLSKPVSRANLIGKINDWASEINTGEATIKTAI